MDPHTVDRSLGGCLTGLVGESKATGFDDSLFLNRLEKFVQLNPKVKNSLGQC